jgi:23S rRNA (guanosine2251-2'-O)-methyltransferase
VLEALADPEIVIDKVLLATGAREQSAKDIVRAAQERGVRLERLAPERITRISRNGRHDQGVVADVRAPRMRTVQAYTAGLEPAGRSGPDAGGSDDARTREHVLVLDGVTNPANVGMILRTATAAGLRGVVLPHQGVPEVGPLVIKASAGVAYRASILRSVTAEDALQALQDAGFALFGLHGEPDATTIYDAKVPPRAAFVLGGETHGVTPQAARWVHEWLRIPMAGGVESLNVSSAATALAFELVRRSR